MRSMYGNLALMIGEELSTFFGVQTGLTATIYARSSQFGSPARTRRNLCSDFAVGLIAMVPICHVTRRGFRRSGDRFLSAYRVRNEVAAVRIIERRKPMKLSTRSSLLVGIATMAAVLIGGMAFAGPAEAAAPAATSSSSQTSSMTIVEANAVVVGGIPTFYYAQAISQGAALNDVSQFAAGIRAGGIGEVVGGPTVPTSRRLAVPNVKGCGGVTKVTSNWAGHTIYLNSCDANTVAGESGAGASATVIVGLIFSETGFGIPVAVLGAVLGFFAGWITASNNRNQGVEIHEPYIGIISVSSQ